MYNWIHVIVLFAGAPAAFLAGYLLLLTMAASRAARSTPLAPGRPRQRFRLLIPAHNEERLLPALLESVARVDYPADLYDVHVVADNCSDGTAAIARAAGAVVHERTAPLFPGKGQALNWLLARLGPGQAADGALVFLDADSVIAPNFLRVMAARLERGEQAIQAYYAVRNPERSPAASLRFAALAALHYLRPQGRMVLGGSAGLKGNGMVFAADLFRRVRWTPAMTEDIELHMALLLEGVRVRFAPDALVWGEMPDTLAGSRSQHDRWERGRLQMARRYVPRLLRAAGQRVRAGRYRTALALVDAALEHVIPPFSVLVAYSLLLLGVAGLTADIQAASGAFSGIGGERSATLAGLSLALTAGLLAGQGLYLVRAPGRMYRQLLYAPGYVLWKLGQYAQAWRARAEARWVRTTRNKVGGAVPAQTKRGES